MHRQPCPAAAPAAAPEPNLHWRLPHPAVTSGRKHSAAFGNPHRITTVRDHGDGGHARLQLQFGIGDVMTASQVTTFCTTCAALRISRIRPSKFAG
jgi:hypothetical protein